MFNVQIDRESARKMSLEGLRRLSEGEGAFRAASALYQNNVEGASAEEAEQQASRIAEAVRSYEAGVAEADGDLNGWINAQLDRLVEGRDLPGRCAALAQMTAVLRAAGGAPLSDARADYAGATAADEARLRAEFIAEVKNSPLCDTLIEGMSEGFEARCAEQAELCEILPREGGSEALKSVLAMAAYVGAADGDCQELPLEVAALCVSAGMDAMDCSRGQALGKLSPERAEKIRRIIGEVLAVLLCVALIYAAVVLLPQLPAIIPAAVQPHTQWLAPAIKHLGRFLPFILAMSYREIESACRNAVNDVWAFFSGATALNISGKRSANLSQAGSGQTEEASEDEARMAATPDIPIESASEGALADA